MSEELASVLSLEEYRDFVSALTWLNEQENENAALCMEIFLRLHRQIKK